MCNFIFSSEAANLGTFITGLGAIGAVFVAYFQINAWRKQQLHIKTSEVAGRALTGVLRLFQAMSYITVPVVDTPTDPVQEVGPLKKTYRQRKDFSDRLVTTAEDLNNFFQIKNECEVYLPDSVNDKLGEVWKCWVSIKVDIPIHFSFLDSGNTSHSENIRAYDNSFGTSGRAAREKLESEIKALLKPIAKLEHSG